MEEQSPTVPQPGPAGAEPASAPEEAISLKELFPKAQEDLDALFPEATMKKLLQDLVRTKQKNERFLKRMDLGDIPAGEE